MTGKSKYGLESMEVGETKKFHPWTPEDHARLRRSAHNFNARTDMFFTTRTKDGVVYVTRIR